MNSSQFRTDSYTHVLIGDVVYALDRIERENTPTHRRELIRAAFAGMEGLHWKLKRTVLDHADRFVDLSIHERAALLEETYSVDERGSVRVQSRFLSLPVAIRLVVNIVQRYSASYKVDFNHAGWSNLRAAAEVRNRLVHPKNLDDLQVSDLEIRQTASGFNWLVALVIEVNSETIAHFEDQVSSLHDAVGRLSDSNAPS